MTKALLSELIFIFIAFLLIWVLLAVGVDKVIDILIKWR